MSRKNSFSFFKSGKSHHARQNLKKLKNRCLSMELLEHRQLLSVSPCSAPSDDASIMEAASFDCSQVDLARETVSSVELPEALSAAGKVQKVHSTTSSITAQPGKTFTVPVMYEALDGKGNLTGLGLRIHYDSSKLTYNSVENLLNSGRVGSIQDKDDVNNNDGDSSTDRVLVISWMDQDGTWPGVAEQLLMNLKFTVKTNASGTAMIRFSASSKASGYSFESEPISVTISSVKEKASTKVTTNVDIVNAYDGVISLREALNYASTGATITFDESLRNQTIVLDGSRLDVTKAVSIQANDLNVTIDADEKSEVMYVNVNKKEGTVQLQGLTLAGGISENGNAAGVTVATLANVVIKDCVLRDNEETGEGKGSVIQLDAKGTLRLENTSITRNGGSSAVNNLGTLTMLNCEVTQNNGTGINGLGTQNIVNCTIVGNAKNGVSSTGSAKTTISNSIVAKNLGGDVSGKTTLKNSLTGVTNPGFTYLPDFANYEQWLNVREEDWDLTLKSDSVAINRGDNKLLTAAGASSATTDLAGNRRISNKTVDAGAYEYQCPSIASPEVTTFIDGKNVNVSWNAISGAASYNVEYRVVGASKWTVKNGVKTNFLTFAAKVGTTYEIRVTTVSGSASLDDSAVSASTVTCTQMLANLKLKATYQGDDNATVSVTGLANNVTRLQVKLGSDSARVSLNGVKVAIGSARCAFQNGSLVFTGLTSSTKYALEVQQIVDSGSPLIASAVTKATITTTKTCYNTPQNVTAQALSDTQVTVNWSAVTGKKSTQMATFYTVQYSVAGSGKWSSATTKATGTSYTIAKLNGGTSYEFRVFATSDKTFLASGFSGSVRAVTLPTAPKIASVASKVTGQVIMTWSATGQVQKYEIRYRIKGSSNWQTVEVPSTGLKGAYTFTNLTSGKAYEFQIRSIDFQLTYSPWSVSKELGKVR